MEIEVVFDKPSDEPTAVGCYIDENQEVKVITNNGVIVNVRPLNLKEINYGKGRSFNNKTK